jgi:hypothetical protein
MNRQGAALVYPQSYPLFAALSHKHVTSEDLYAVVGWTNESIAAQRSWDPVLVPVEGTGEAEDMGKKAATYAHLEITFFTDLAAGREWVRKRRQEPPQEPPLTPSG